MSSRPSPIRRAIAFAPDLVIGAILLWFVVTMVLPQVPRMLELRPAPGAPHWDLLLAQPAAIQLHVAGALTALGLGIVQLLGPKGTMSHRVLGWTWVAAMLLTAISSLFIRQINSGAFSLIHILSGMTLIALPMAVHAARRHDIARHRGAMTGLFFGALIVAGALALLPGRLMWAVLVG